MTSKARQRKRDVADSDPDEAEEEPVIEITLSSFTSPCTREVLFVFKDGEYQRMTQGDLTIDLLTIPTRIIHMEEHQLQQQKEKQKAGGEEEEEKEKEEGASENAGKDEEAENIFQELQAVYGGMVSAEQLAKLDSQPNPFNFSDRVSQTVKVISKPASTQTDPPPGAVFSETACLSAIYDAYERDYAIVLVRQREIEKQKEMEEEKEREKTGKAPEKKDKSSKFQRAGKNEIGKTPKLPPDPIVLPPPPPPPRPTLGGEELDLDPLTVKMTERIVNQNIYDEITQDFRYWEDASDEYRQLEGSLLPLWKFSCDRSRGLVVSAISWSPTLHDLFAAGYTSEKLCDGESEGRICLYTLKNPGIPERMLVTDQGVTSLQFHPTRESVLVAGHSDGTVTVYDARRTICPGRISSSTSTGKHLLPVMQVRWIQTEPGESLGFFSVSQDGRVSRWTVRTTCLQYTDILNFSTNADTPENTSGSCKVSLEGTATCIAQSPESKDVLLFGVDTGALFQVCTSNAAHAVTRYRAHLSPVTAVVWNMIHTKVFASCSLDWTVKIWLQYHLSPLMTLDLGGPVMEVTWSPSNSTLVVSVTEDGRVHIYDLFLRRYLPMCVQNLLQRRRSSLSCVAFNPSQPIILVGGEKGYLVAFKLSPNLRRPHKDAKGAEEESARAIEICKMERIIVTSKR